MYKDLYNEWIDKADTANKNELLLLSDDEKSIEDRFYKDISFGTGGLRGKLGAGTNRMNIYTVSRVTLGIAEYIKKNGIKKSVAIAYDSRNMSEEFARVSAEIFSSQGIEAYIFKEIAPTPVLSYAVRYLSTDMGVVITASHNPKEYNGYKVYNHYGCQITDLTAKIISDEISLFGYFNEYSVRKEKIHYLSNEVLEKFIKEVEKFSVYRNEKYYPKVVYTPLNGTGNIPVQKLFTQIGLTDYTIVKEQQNPDGDFRTCPYPNPEEQSALSLAVEYAKRNNADLVIATDPDADRVGVAVKNGKEYRLLNGNETGVLLEYFLLSVKGKKFNSTDKPYIVKTIVTTDLSTKVAEHFGVNTKEVLTGFKYIGETIDRFPNEKYVFGMEESFGYLVGTHVRDKDSISAIMLIVEMFSWYKEKGISLIDALEAIYLEYGYYISKLHYKTYEGSDGMKQMKDFMSRLRKNIPDDIGSEKTERVNDYSLGVDNLPVSDVIKLQSADSSLIIRPSGTEPKIKFYLNAVKKNKQEAEKTINSMLDQINKMLDD